MYGNITLGVATPSPFIKVEPASPRARSLEEGEWDSPNPAAVKDCYPDYGNREPAPSPTGFQGVPGLGLTFGAAGPVPLPLDFINPAQLLQDKPICYDDTFLSMAQVNPHSSAVPPAYGPMGGTTNGSYTAANLAPPVVASFNGPSTTANQGRPAAIAAAAPAAAAPATVPAAAPAAGTFGGKLGHLITTGNRYSPKRKYSYDSTPRSDSGRSGSSSSRGTRRRRRSRSSSDMATTSKPAPSPSPRGLNISIANCTGCHGMAASGPVAVTSAAGAAGTQGMPLDKICKEGDTLYFCTVDNDSHQCTGNGMYDRF